MAYDDKKEINVSDIVNSLGSIDFSEYNTQYPQPYTMPQPSNNYPTHSGVAPYTPPISAPTYAGNLVPNNAIQKEIQRKIRYENSVQAFSEIYNTPRGLCGINKFGAERVVFPLELEACIYVKPDSLYSLKPFYRIKFKGHSSPLDIPEKEFTSPSKLVQTLMLHFGQEFNFNQNKGKVQIGTQALLNRVAKANPQFDLLFYSGWIKNESTWEYSLANRKTHGSRNIINNAKTFTPPESVSAPTIPSSSVQLTAAMQVAEMMNAFSTPSMRNIVWNLLHVASLYSLLDGIGYRFPLGVCIRSDEALVQNVFNILLSWFEDKAIVLSESSSDFITLATERKDQPLFIQDIAAQISNSKMIETAIQTGKLSRKDESYKLYALPVILSNCDSHLSLSPSIMRLDFPLHELESHAYQVLGNQQPYFQDYLLHFNLFVQNNIELFQSSLKAHSMHAFEDSPKYALSSECTTALAVIHAVEDLTKLYFDSLHASEVLNKQLSSIFSTDAESTLLSILAQTSHRECNASIAELFASVANQKLQEGLFEIRKHGEDDTYDPCPPDKQGIVFVYDGDLCFSKESFDALVDLTGYGYYTVLGALKDVHAFSGKPLSTKTPQYKMPGPNTLSGQPNTHVYRFSKDFISIPEKQSAVIPSPVLKSPNECNITLQVGTSIDGNPIVWNGIKNSHICITGTTGSGKTYFLKKLIAQLPEQNARCIVFDVESDFFKTGMESPSAWNNLPFDVIDWEDAHIDPIPFYPIIPDESNEKIANRITNTLSVILAMGEVQGPLVKSIILSGLEDHSITCLHQLISKTYRPIKKTLSSVKLESLSSIAPKDCTPFDWKLDTAGVTIVRINKGDDTNTLMNLMEMILSTLYFMKKYGQKSSNIPLIFVLDECMLLNWNKDWTAHQIMIRGRKDGMCAWLSSQFIPSSKESQIWEEADMRIYFEHTDDDSKKIAKQLARSNKILQDYYYDQLGHLERGQFIFKQNRNVIISQVPDGSET